MQPSDSGAEYGPGVAPAEAYEIITDLTSDYAYSFLVDEAGNLTPEWMTRGYELLTGFTEKEVEEAGGWPAFVHPDSFAAAAAGMEGILRGETVEMDVLILCKDGDVREVHAKTVPVQDDTGRTVRIFGAVQDVTERRRSERLLENQAEVLGMVARGAPLTETLGTIVAHIEAASAGMMCSILLLDGDVLRVGYAKSLPQPVADVCEGLEIGPRNGSCGRAAYLGEPVISSDVATDPIWEDFRDLVLDNGLRACWSHPIKGDESGDILGTFATYYGEVREPTAAELDLVMRWVDLAAVAIERAKAVQALEASEQRFTELAENIEEVFWIADRENKRAAYVSPAFEQIWGISSKQLYDSSQEWVDSIHPDDRAKVLDLLHTPPEEGFEFEYRIFRTDGSIRWIKDRGFPVKTGEGPITRVAGLSEDITEKKRLEDHLRRTQRMEAVGRLAGGIAHDFNNLLFVILNSARFVSEDLPDGDPRRSDIDEIISAGERAAKLTRQLLIYGRKELVSPKVLDINDVVRRMDDLLRRTIGEDIELTTQLGRDLRQVRIDPAQLEQVILNLAVNARDAMQRGGTLSIETTNAMVDENASPALGGISSGPYVCLTISDTGVGMDADVAGQAFEPFFTTKQFGESSGLGLATVYGIVTQADGHVSVYSEPRIGTTFRIYLPVVEASPEDEGIAHQRMRKGSGETVLVAEDDGAVLDLAGRILKKHGYKVLRATSGDTAMRYARGDDPIDVLLTDVIMPRMSGRELAIHLKTLRPEVKILFMSGYTADIIGRHGILDEDQNYMQKPFTADELLAKIHEVLDS